MNKMHVLFLLAGSLLLLFEPALANKFETISGGVNGSFRAKTEFIQTLMLILGSGFMLGAVLAVVVPRSNAAFLNYANWKASSAVMATLGTVMLVSYFLI